MAALTQDQILAAYNRAPQLVRDAFNAESTTQAVVDLRNQHKLHIDTAGTIGKELGYMLLGLVNPSEFVAHLRAAGLHDDLIRTIVSEINEKIFKPLQQQMREQGPGGGAAPQQSAAPPPRPVQRYSAPAPPMPTQQTAPPPPPPPQPQPVAPAPRPVQLPPTGPERYRGAQPAISLPPLNAPSGSASGDRPAAGLAAQPQYRPMPQTPGAAPLPPRTVLPGASAPRFVKPMQAADPEIMRGAPPPNLPTYANPAAPPSAAQPEQGDFNHLPPLAKPKTAGRDPQAPHTDYPSDPYREPVE